MNWITLCNKILASNKLSNIIMNKTARVKFELNPLSHLKSLAERCVGSQSPMFTNDINKRSGIELSQNSLLRRKKNSIDRNSSHWIIQKESLRPQKGLKLAKKDKYYRQIKNYDSNRSLMKKVIVKVFIIIEFKLR